MDKNGISIEFKYNEREIEGIDEFKKEVESSYSSQCHELGLPSCSEGGELILKIILETDWSSFVAGAVASGLLWDGIKCAGKTFILKPLANAIDKLFKRNEDGYVLKLVKTSFIFENIEILVYGLSDNYKDELDKILYHISTRIDEIEEEHNLQIVTIELPYYYDEDNELLYVQDSLSDKYKEPQLIKFVFQNDESYYEEFNVI